MISSDEKTNRVSNKSEEVVNKVKSKVDDSSNVKDRPRSVLKKSCLSILFNLTLVREQSIYKNFSNIIDAE
jgi:hypothetical protein